MGQYETARQFCEKALSIELKTIGSNHLAVSATYNNIGTIYQHMKRFSDALDYHIKALQIELKIFNGVNHPLIALTINNVGTVCMRIEEYSEAMNYFERALQIQLETLKTDNHPLIATTLNNIATTYSRIKNHEKSIEYFVRALNVRLALTDHLAASETYDNMAQHYKEQE